MLDNSKEEILSRLYVLRAGMSVISLEKEKIDNLKEEIKEDKNQSKYRIKSCEERIKKDKKMLISENEKLKRTDTTYSERKKMQTKNKLSLLGKLLLLPLAVFCAIWPFEFVRYYDSNHLDNDTLAVVSFFLMLLSYAVVILCVIGWFLWIKNKEIVPYSREQFEKLEQQSAWIQIFKKEAPGKINALNEEIGVLTQRISEERKECDLMIATKNGLIINQIGQGLVFYAILEEAYRGFLDVRDWQHVDLLIFYFESGRADDLKEALLLVDRQLQNDAIVNAINDASSRICGTINAGLQQLQSSMVKCFSLLSEQMYSMQMQMEIQHNEQMAIQRAQLAGVLELAKQTNMSNALMQKANMNSMKLMEDVGYMKMLAEHENIRKSNNI